MCKIVHLTSERFDIGANRFKHLLKEELKQRGIEVVLDYSYDIFNVFKKHNTYGISIAIDFYKDNSEGKGIIINKQCSEISKAFSYNLSNILDETLPTIKWRGISFVKSDDKIWYNFFNRVSSETKVILKLCTKTKKQEYFDYNSSVDKIVELFSEEIVRCLRSDYNYITYQKMVELSRKKKNLVKYGVVKG